MFSFFFLTECLSTRINPFTQYQDQLDIQVTPSKQLIISCSNCTKKITIRHSKITFGQRMTKSIKQSNETLKAIIVAFTNIQNAIMIVKTGAQAMGLLISIEYISCTHLECVVSPALSTRRRQWGGTFKTNLKTEIQTSVSGR